MVSRYVPDTGDLVWLTFDPQAGSEQSGRRPALVVTPRAYNSASGLALFCPITSRVKGYPFEVTLDADATIQGVALVDHLKSLDWSARKATFIATVPAATLAEVRAKLRPLLGLQ